MSATTSDTTPANTIVRGTHGWLYEFKRVGNNLRFIRYPEGEREYHGSPSTIFLEFCADFERPMRIRQALASYSTAGERVINAAIQLAS